MIPFARMLIISIVACLILQLGVGYLAGVKLGVWSYSDSSALVLLGMSSGSLTLGLVEYLYLSRFYAMLWFVYLLLSPVFVVFAVN